MDMYADCQDCGSRIVVDRLSATVQCDRCRTMGGTDIASIIAECRRTIIPGQKILLKLIELLNQKIDKQRR